MTDSIDASPIDRRSPIADPASRLLAFALDTLVLIVLPALVLAFSIALRIASSSVYVLGSIVVGVVFVVPIQLVLLVRDGQSIGKRIVGLRILRTDGRRVGAARIVFVRAASKLLLSAIPCCGYIFDLTNAILAFPERRQLIHDWIADTIVVRIVSARDANDELAPPP